MTATRQPPRDRRIRKTRQALHEAFDALVSQKSYDAIAVQEILDRANVGRSTFYTHYSGKDDLLAAHIDKVVADESAAPRTVPVPASERLLSFSLPILEHIARHRRDGTGGPRHREESVMHARLRLVVAERIAEALRRNRQGHRIDERGMPPDLLIQYLSSTFVLVLDWWLMSRSRLTPAEVDAMFRSLVRPAIDRR